MKILIVGAGKLGYDLAKVLSLEDHNIIVIDKDSQALKPIADNFDVMTIQGNGASPKLLEEIDIQSFNIVLAVTENDELNMISCMVAKKTGVPVTVARVRNPEYNPMFPSLFSYTNLGIDLFINPEYLAAQELFRLVEVPIANVVDYFADGKLSMIGIKIDDNLMITGKQIQELNLDTFTVVAVIRKGKALIPDGKTTLLSGDKIFILGKTTGFHNLNGLVKQKKPHLNRIIIAGGSLVCQYFIKLLRTRKNVPEIKIIESSIEQCRFLSNELDGCQIVHADATKMEILEEENLGSGDIFIATTGSDNSNLVASMLANKLGANDIICDISREDYISLAETIGVTATITPRLLTVSTVLKLVRGNVISVNLVNAGEAEAVEYEVEKDAPIADAPIKELSIPQGMVIGAIIQNDKVIVPRGDTQIKPGNRVIVFVEHSLALKIEYLFRKQVLIVSKEHYAL